MTELIDDIIYIIKSKNMNFHLLGEKEALILFDKLKEKYEFDYSILYLWEKNYFEKTTVEYENKWEEYLERDLIIFTDTIYIVVSDDNYYPWNMLQGRKTELLSLLKELRFFEYFIFDSRMKMVLFDTHHNTFVKISPELEGMF
jgi:hypothetical protein